MPDAARAVARGLAAGLPLADAFRRGSDAVDSETAAVMLRCARALEEGDPLAVALAPLADCDGGALVAAAIDLQHELGGDLVASLSGIAEGLADRERVQLEGRAATAQARVAARIVPLAPVAALLMLFALSPGAAGALVGSGAGLAILGVSGALTLVALVALRRIARGAGL
jgi:tight adherence protein B